MMKKLIFAAAFCAVGMMSAKDNQNDVCDLQKKHLLTK